MIEKVDVMMKNYKLNVIEFSILGGGNDGSFFGNLVARFPRLLSYPSISIPHVCSPPTRGLTRHLSFFFFGPPLGPQRRSSRSPLGLDCFSADIIRALRVFRFRAIRAIRARGSFFLLLLLFIVG